MNDTLKNDGMYFPEIPIPGYEGMLVKLSDNNGGLRTTTVQGAFSKVPRKGQRFTIMGEALNEGATMRLVNTSPVTEIINHLGGTITFRTENSKYRLDYFKREGV